MRAALGAVALTLIVASGCSAFEDDPDGLQIAAGFYPLQYVAERVAGDLAAVDDLTTPGQEPHDLELTIKETAVIARADLVIHEKGLQPAVDDAVEQNAVGEVIDAAGVVGLEPFKDGAPESDLDPHFWLDPLRMADLGDTVAEVLANLDLDHADEYVANAAALRADLEDLDQAYSAGLATCERQTIVVSHDAFGYLGKYGVEIAPIAGLSPGAEPTPAVLADLQQLIEEDGITTVFGERLASPRLTESLADDMGVQTAILDPIEGLTDETADEDYLSIMRTNLDALREANACT